MEQRDELEIETRLRAALQARSELVTHSTLRPGIPPNEHTAGARSRRESWWSWRRMWVPVTVAAALAGGVFVGAQLPSGSSSDKAQVSPGAGPEASTTDTAGGTVPSSAPGKGTPSGGIQNVSAGTPAAVGTLSFTLAAGWQVTATSGTSGCVTLKSSPAPVAADGTDSLPCGVNAIYLETNAKPTAWPLDAATRATGWWPDESASASDIACPVAQAGSGDMVKDSVLLRSSPKYVLAAQAGQAAPVTADYHEWAVTCTSGSGVQPMLWKLNPAAGSPAPATFAVAAAVSADPAYDSALLGMVGSLHQAS